MKTAASTTGLFIFGSFLCLAGCGQSTDPDPTRSTGSPQEKIVIDMTSPAVSIADAPIPEPADVQIEIGNTRYLFVLADHSTKDLLDLLTRTDEIARTSLDHFDELEIALIIHGPTVEIFTEKNYQKNKELVDLAARLDAFKVIDLKICERSLSGRGVTRDEIPSFIESVPYAPDEIKRLTEEGYINL